MPVGGHHTVATGRSGGDARRSIYAGEYLPAEHAVRHQPPTSPMPRARDVTLARRLRCAAANGVIDNFEDAHAGLPTSSLTPERLSELAPGAASLEQARAEVARDRADIHRATRLTSTRESPAPTLAPLRGARRRGAGRPRAQASRSAARSGDSGSDPDEPAPALRLAPTRGVYKYAARGAA